MSGAEVTPWIIAGLSTALSVALGVMAVITRRLGDAEGERRILREVLAAHRQRCASSSSSSSPVDYGPVRPAGMKMSDWKRIQAGEKPEDEGAED